MENIEIERKYKITEKIYNDIYFLSLHFPFLDE